MEKSLEEITAGRAALIAGIGYLLMLGTPFAEFYAMPKLLNADGAMILKNIITQSYYLRTAIAGYTINFVGDVLAAWGLYILLKPVNKNLSLLVCWLRIIYTVISLAALLNLVTLLSITKQAGQYDTAFLTNQTNLLYSAFTDGWRLAYLFFGLYLGLLGYLIIRAWYVPTWIGIWIIAAGAAWTIHGLQFLLFPTLHINFAIVAIAGFGEMVLMFWLLIKGWSVKIAPLSPSAAA